MFIFIPNEYPIFIENIDVSNVQKEFPHFELDPGITETGMKYYKLDVNILFVDDLYPKNILFERRDPNEKTITEQFFGWLTYLRTTLREFDHWNLQLNNVFITNTGYITLL